MARLFDPRLAIRLRRRVTGLRLHRMHRHALIDVRRIVCALTLPHRLIRLLRRARLARNGMSAR